MEQVGESHCHDCSAHLQQLRQFLRRVTEALLQRQLKRLHLGVVTRPLGSQRVTDIAREIKGNQGNKYEKIKEQKVL
jgi:tRNA U54 and U55 pseudouridine synthase Pus10